MTEDLEQEQIQLRGRDRALLFVAYGALKSTAGTNPEIIQMLEKQLFEPPPKGVQFKWYKPGDLGKVMAERNGLTQDNFFTDQGF